MKRLVLLLLLIAVPAGAQPSEREPTEAETELEEAEESEPEPEEAEESETELDESEAEVQEIPYEEPEPLPPHWNKQSADSAARRALESRRHRFCRDPDATIPANERWLCDLAPAARPRCPEFEQACKKAAASAARTGSAEGRRRERRNDEQAPFKLPESFGWLATALFWMIVVGGALALVLAILRHAFGRFKEEEAATAPAAGGPGDEGPAAPPRAVETDVDRLLARAHAAVARGDHAQGIADAYAALLRHLDGEGLVHLHPSATNGDFVRGLRQHPETQTGVRAVVRDVDRLQFGRAAATADVSERVLRRVVSMVARGATVALLALFCAGCGANDLDGEGGSQHSPGGYSVLVSALEQNGKVRSRIEPLEALSEELDLVIVLADLERDEWTALEQWVRVGGIAVVGIDPEPASEWLEVHRVQYGCAGPFAVAAGALPETATLVAPRGPTLSIDAERTEVVARCGGAPYFVRVRHGLGRVLVVDEALLTNASLACADNAYVVLDSLGAPRQVELVNQFTGSGTETPFAALSNARLVPTLAQLFLLLLVAFIARGWPFGKLREPLGRARGAFVDHVRALGAQYAKARATRLVFGSYAAWALDRLRERALPGPKASLLGLAEAIAARTGKDEREVVKVLVEADAARVDTERSGSAPADLAAMKQLEGLLSRTGGDGWTSKGSKIVSAK